MRFTCILLATCIINNNKKLNYDLILLLKRFYYSTNKYNTIGRASLLFTSLLMNCDALSLSN